MAKRVTLKQIFIKASLKHKHIRRTSDCEWQQDCFFEFASVSKKKKISNQAFDRNKPADFFYCQFNY